MGYLRLHLVKLSSSRGVDTLDIWGGHIGHFVHVGLDMPLPVDTLGGELASLYPSADGLGRDLVMCRGLRDGQTGHGGGHHVHTYDEKPMGFHLKVSA